MFNFSSNFMYLIDPAVADFYTHSSEESRLLSGLGPLEFERNKTLITRYLSGRNMRVADVGGGTGHYSDWLSSLGHRVDLIDPVQRHIEKARKRASGKFSCQLAEAKNLPLPDSSFDLVILHGPLYHLLKKEDRLLAIREARRILRPGGTVLGFAITRAASCIAALHTGMIHDPGIFQMCLNTLSTGEQHAPADIRGILSHAYFHSSEELAEEFSNYDLQLKGIYAVEGLAWMDTGFFQSWADPGKKERLLKLISLTEQKASLLGISPHMMIAAELVV